MEYKFLFDIAVILIFTKLFGIITRKLHMPQVVGALIGGIIMGPAVLNWVEETEFIHQLAEIGVVVLMFMAGIETNFKELKNSGKPSFFVAAIGVVVPILGGASIGYFSDATGSGFYDNLFIGIVLSATSVSITVETLRELGKLNTKVANTLLGAAIIDDFLGIILLTFISTVSSTAEKTEILDSLLKILLYFVLVAIVSFILYKVLPRWFHTTEQALRRYAVAAFALCLLFSFVTEYYFGVADIIGAFITGLIISTTDMNHYIRQRCEVISYMFISPVFFASVGLKTNFKEMNVSLIVFSIIFTVTAILTKILGGFIGAKISRFTNKESIQIGSGMVSRGEVALIMANKGKVLGLVNDVLFAPIILMVTATSIISPILLKISFYSKKNDIEKNT